MISHRGCLSTALHRHDQLAKYHPVLWLRWPNVSWHQVFHLREPIVNLIIMHLSWIYRESIVNLSWIYREPIPDASHLKCVWRIKFMKIMEFGLKWVHMARYGVILRLDGALWLTIISKSPLTPRRAIQIQNWPNPALLVAICCFSMPWLVWRGLQDFLWIFWFIYSPFLGQEGSRNYRMP